jgi:hypothetical protein
LKRLDVRASERLSVQALTSPSDDWANVQASERPSVQASKRLVARKDGRELRRMTVYLPADLAKRLAVHCAGEDRDMSDAITDAVRGLLDATS